MACQVQVNLICAEDANNAYLLLIMLSINSLFFMLYLRSFCSVGILYPRSRSISHLEVITFYYSTWGFQNFYHKLSREPIFCDLNIRESRIDSQKPTHTVYAKKKSN